MDATPPPQAIEVSATAPAAPELTPVQQFFDAKTKQDRAAVVQKYPELAKTYSAAHWE